MPAVSSDHMRADWFMSELDHIAVPRRGTDTERVRLSDFLRA